jgi:hypothetical protein
MNVPLLVPAPSWTFDPLPGGVAPIEGAVSIAIAPVRFPDGSEMVADEMVAAHLLLSRAVAPNVPLEIWDHATKRWRDALSIDPAQLAGLPLLPPSGAGGPWTGVLAAAALKDATGAPALRESSGGFPLYRARGSFRATRPGQTAAGVGPEGIPVHFGSKLASARFAAVPSPDTDAPTRIQLVLRDGAARPVAMVQLDASGGGPSLMLRSFDGSGNAEASVEIETDGTIRLTRAPGRRVVIAGDVDVDRVTYLPSAGLPRKTLN